MIGVTGGIACGKSTVVKICQGYGAAIVDADILGHRSYEPGTDCFRKLIETFGEQIVGEDGSINRRVLGGIVFADKAQRKKLEGVVWPEIKRLLHLELESLFDSGVPAIVVEAAVMLEAGWQSEVDELWVVAVDSEVARQRLVARNKLTEEDADKRIQAQMSNAARIALADRVIWNNGTRDELEGHVSVAWRERGALRSRKEAMRNRSKIMLALLGFAILAALGLRPKLLRS